MGESDCVQHNERTALELLDRMRRASGVHEQQVEELPEEIQEEVAEPPQKRQYNAVSDTTKECLLSLVQAFPNESIQFFAERFSISRHNLRKLVRNMKQPGFKLEKKQEGGSHSSHQRTLRQLLIPSERKLLQPWRSFK